MWEARTVRDGRRMEIETGMKGSNRVGEIWKTEMTKVQWSAVGVEGEKRGYKGKQCIGKEILGRHRQTSSAVGGDVSGGYSS